MSDIVRNMTEPPLPYLGRYVEVYPRTPGAVVIPPGKGADVDDEGWGNGGNGLFERFGGSYDTD